MKNIAKLLAAALIAFAQIPMASAASFPGVVPVNDDLQGYLDNYGFFNGYSEVKKLNFKGKWQFTAIARESGNTNTVSLTKKGAPTFTTADYSNWGVWNDVNFDNEKLFFEDSNGPYNVKLDPFKKPKYPFFKVFELTSDSNLLAYLGANALKLEAGTLIVGFNDNGLKLGDADYDDIIVAMKSVSPVPVPAAVWLFGTALLGLIGIHRRKRAMA